MTLVKKNNASPLAPQTFADAVKFAEMLAETRMVPDQYFGRPGDILAAIQMGGELGLSPMASLQNIAVINGKPTVYGDALLALATAHHECEDIQERFDTETQAATCTVKRAGRTPVVRSFSAADAKRAGLWGRKGPWSSYPQRMLQMRARAFAVRDCFPDALRGLGVYEEVSDYDKPRPQPTQVLEDAPRIPEPVVVSLPEPEVVAAPEPAPEPAPAPVRRGRPTNAERWEKAVQWFRDHEIGEADLLRYCAIGAAEQAKKQHLDKLAAASARIKAGEYPLSVIGIAPDGSDAIPPLPAPAPTEVTHEPHA